MFSLRFLLVVALESVLVFVESAPPRTKRDVITNVNAICNNIKAKNFSMNLRGAFIFHKSLILISNDWLVYEVPNTSLQTYGKMLFNVSSIPIEQKFPAFRTNARFHEIKNRIKNIFSFDKINTNTNKYHPTLYMEVYSHNTSDYGIVYELEKDLIWPGHCYFVSPDMQGKKPQDQAITSVDAGYSIQLKSTDSTLMFIPWHYNFYPDGSYSTAGFSHIYFMYYKVPRSNTSLRNRIYISYLPKENYLALFPDYVFYPILDWNLPPGYLYNGYFHFFDRTRIYMFANGAIERQNIDAELRVIEAQDFFDCNTNNTNWTVVTYPPVTTPNPRITRDVSFGTEKNYRPLPIHIAQALSSGQITGIIVAVIVVLGCLVAIAFTCYFVEYDSGSKKFRRRRRHRKGPTPKETGSKPKSTERPSVATTKLATSASKQSLATVKN